MNSLVNVSTVIETMVLAKATSGYEATRPSTLGIAQMRGALASTLVMRAGIELTLTISDRLGFDFHGAIHGLISNHRMEGSTSPYNTSGWSTESKTEICP